MYCNSGNTLTVVRFITYMLLIHFIFLWFKTFSIFQTPNFRKIKSFIYNNKWLVVLKIKTQKFKLNLIYLWFEQFPQVYICQAILSLLIIHVTGHKLQNQKFPTSRTKISFLTLIWVYEFEYRYYWPNIRPVTNQHRG